MAKLKAHLRDPTNPIAAQFVAGHSTLLIYGVLSIHKPTLEGGKVPDNDGVVQVKTGAHLRRQQHLVGKEKTRPGSSKELIKSGNLELLRKESVLAPTEIDDLTTE